MPIIKIIPSKSRVQPIEAYLKNPSKTNQQFYFGNLCDYENVAESFQQWNQCLSINTKQRTYYHIIISFNPKDNVSPEKCIEIAKEVCKKNGMTDYPYFGTIHTDTEHMHAHIILDNVSIWGKCYHSTRESTMELIKSGNEICAREGFVHSIVDMEQRAKDRVTMAEAQMILKRKVTPWKETLRHQIEDAIQNSASMAGFCNYLHTMYGVDVSESGKGEFRFHSPGVKKPCPSKRLGEAYMAKNIKRRLESREREIERGIKR